MSREPESSFSSDQRELFYYETLSEIRSERGSMMLHEPLWTLNGRYPNSTVQDREALAESTLLRLLDEGLIVVIRSGTQALDPAEAQSLIRGHAWRTVPVAREFDLVITPSGEAALDRVPDDTWDRVFPDRREA